jgi:hypothetical protein
MCRHLHFFERTSDALATPIGATPPTPVRLTAIMPHNGALLLSRTQASVAGRGAALFVA